jgi:hypothetical protein
VSATEAPRANRDGQPCPSWCTTDHDKPIIDGEPMYGFMAIHNSDNLSHGFPPVAVKVTRWPLEEKTTVRVDGADRLRITADQAAALALILEARHSLAGIASLIDELRYAAQVAWDTDGAS